MDVLSIILNWGHSVDDLFGGDQDAWCVVLIFLRGAAVIHSLDV